MEPEEPLAEPELKIPVNIKSEIKSEESIEASKKSKVG